MACWPSIPSQPCGLMVLLAFGWCASQKNIFKAVYCMNKCILQRSRRKMCNSLRAHYKVDTYPL